MKQIHDRMVIDPKNPEEMTREEKSAALKYLMFLKQKKNGTMKGRGCADGRSQRASIDKSSVSAPTVATESVLLTSIIDALEKRDVATVDIPGAFLHADMEGDDVHVKFEGRLAEMLVKINPQMYRKYIRDENGKTIMYVQLKKALYGTMQAAMLFWKNLTGSLQEWGFTINPYDWCVANKMVNNKQITVVWHVHDLKISHVDADVVTTFIKTLSKRYGSNDAPLTIKRGKIHEYIGMTLDYSKNDKVIVDMVSFVREIIDASLEIFNGLAKTPAASHLFEVNESAEQLNEEKGTLFHHLVYKILFLCKRGADQTCKQQSLFLLPECLNQT